MEVALVCLILLFICHILELDSTFKFALILVSNLPFHCIINLHHWLLYYIIIQSLVPRLCNTTCAMSISIPRMINEVIWINFFVLGKYLIEQALQVMQQCYVNPLWCKPGCCPPILFEIDKNIKQQTWRVCSLSTMVIWTSLTLLGCTIYYLPYLWFWFRISSFLNLLFLDYPRAVTLGLSRNECRLDWTKFVLRVVL